MVAVGGPAVTPWDDDPRQRASGAVYASALVSAGEARRYVPRPAGEADFMPRLHREARAAYAVLVAVEAMRGARRHHADPATVALGIYLTHLTFGAGVLSGLVRRELDH